MGLVSLSVSANVREITPTCTVCDLDGEGRCLACGDQVEGLEATVPANILSTADLALLKWGQGYSEGHIRKAWGGEGPNVPPKVTLEALKTFLNSGASWDEIQRSMLLGQKSVSGVTRMGRACPKGHAKRGPGRCIHCTRERVRKSKAKRKALRG